MLDHNYIGTEHMLLGLLHEGEGVAALVLKNLDVDLEGIRAWIVDLIGNGQHTPTGHIPFTPRAKKVMEMSLREALQLGHNYVGTEHLLLGLIREGEGVGCQALESAGLTLNGTRQAVLDTLSGNVPKPATVNFSTGDEDQAVFPPYSTDGCPKCGNENVRASYQPAKAHYSKVLKRVWALSEHLRRVCGDCGYEWAEACRTNLMAPGASWTAEQDLNERIKALQKEAEQSESTPAD